MLFESDGIGLHRLQQATQDQGRPLGSYNDTRNSTCNTDATDGVNSGTYVQTLKQTQKSQTNKMKLTICIELEDSMKLQ